MKLLLAIALWLILGSDWSTELGRHWLLTCVRGAFDREALELLGVICFAHFKSLAALFFSFSARESAGSDLILVDHRRQLVDPRLKKISGLRIGPIKLVRRPRIFLVLHGAFDALIGESERVLVMRLRRRSLTLHFLILLIFSHPIFLLARQNLFCQGLSARLLIWPFWRQKEFQIGDRFEV